jgi:Fe(3+) dicitrate transport protein
VRESKAVQMAKAPVIKDAEIRHALKVAAVTGHPRTKGLDSRGMHLASVTFQFTPAASMKRLPLRLPVHRPLVAVCASLLTVPGLLTAQTVAAPAAAASAPAPAADREVETVLVTGERVVPRWLYNQQTRYEHSRPEVEGAEITVTKKTSVVRVDLLPTIIDNNQRALFNALPGLNLAEQSNPVQLNVSYRGLGNPQESEYVLSLVDGIPIATDWIAVPTTYILPVPQTVQSLQLVRGGSSLLYGPQPGPVLNYITKRAPAGTPFFFSTEQVGGSNSLFSSFNAVGGREGAFEYVADLSYRKSDGQRSNGDYKVTAADLHLGYDLGSGNKVGLDVKGYSVNSGLAGLQTVQQFAVNPSLTTTPNDREWIDRSMAALTGNFQLSEGLSLDGKLWNGEQRLTTRAVGATTTALTDQRYHFSGVDARFKQRLSRSEWLTFGFTGYSSVGPWHVNTGTNPTVDRNDTTAPLTYSDDRTTRYGAIFVEGVWRYPSFHIVPSARLERIIVAAAETVASGHPTNLINRSIARNVPLLGLGIGNDFGKGNETYLNISQGYRPVRYQEFASPNGNFNAASNPDPTKYLSYEAGVHGWPLEGVFYNVSVFQTNITNKIESQASGIPGQSVNVNSGAARSRGLEFEINYDLLRLLDQKPTGQRLALSFNTSLLDAKFTNSNVLAFAGGPTLAGNTLAYAPRYLVKAGLNYTVANVLKLALNGQATGSQFWADSNQPRTAGGVEVTPAKIPAVVVADFSADYTVAPHVRLLGSVANLSNKRYYSRVFFVNGGIEPAKSRSFQAGAALDF